jgi:hypothetical protein
MSAAEIIACAQSLPSAIETAIYAERAAVHHFGAHAATEFYARVSDVWAQYAQRLAGLRQHLAQARCEASDYSAARSAIDASAEEIAAVVRRLS